MRITFVLALVMLLGVSLAFRSRMQSKARYIEEDGYNTDWNEVDYYVPEECAWWGQWLQEWGLYDVHEDGECVVTHGGDSCSCLDWEWEDDWEEDDWECDEDDWWCCDEDDEECQDW